MKSLFLALLPLAIATIALGQSDTLTAGIAPYPGQNGKVLKGTTPDLALLEIRTLTIRSAIVLSGKPDSADQLLIIKEGNLDLTCSDSTSHLDEGSVVLIPAGVSYNLEARSSTYYRFRFISRRAPDPSSPATPQTPTTAARTASPSLPFILRWSDMPVQHTAKGETRQIFSRPTAWLSKIDLHATTLNPGEVSHPPHVHRTEEIILMRTGHVQEYINGKEYPAADGDLIFLPSGNPHALENHSAAKAEYFALQWQP
jgi:(S)-ureidoglycine aminohydrolase